MEMHIEKLCSLAKLQIGREEKEALGKDIAEILEWVKALERIPDSSVARRRVSEELRADKAGKWRD